MVSVGPYIIFDSIIDPYKEGDIIYTLSVIGDNDYKNNPGFFTIVKILDRNSTPRYNKYGIVERITDLEE